VKSGNSDKTKNQHNDIKNQTKTGEQKDSQNQDFQKGLFSILINKKLLEQEEVVAVEERSKEENKSVIQVLRESGLILPDDLAKTLAEFYDLPYISLKEADFNIEIISRLPEEISKKYYLIVFDVTGDKLFKIATSRPEEPQVAQIIGFLKAKNNIDTELFVTSETSVLKALEKYAESKKTNVFKNIKNPFIDAETRKADLQEKSQIQNQQQQASVSQPENIVAANVDTGELIIDQLVQGKLETPEDLKRVCDTGMAPTILAGLIKYAIFLRASDIHIEPEEKFLKVRFRVDGVLKNIIDVNLSLHPAIIARVKISAHLKIDEQRIPQDGRFDVSFENREIDIRVSTLPTSHGEKVVLRLLDKSKGVLSLEDLGLTGNAYKILQENIAKPFGMILATGPTGSGKTTTLYAVLQKINNPEINIVTLEDPVEYQLDGVNHCQVKPQIGFDFANGLRSIVRQDPDVIMVGEIRDKETAEMAIHAALTGHLMLSTLHTNNAGGAATRLIDMGIEPFLISSTLNVVLAQRLVRRICEKCKTEAQVPTELYQKIEKEIQNLPTEIKSKINGKPKFYKGKGCSECSNGYKGRVGVYEVMNMSDTVQDAIVNKATAEEIQILAVKNGMLTIRQDALIKALQGVTTLDEVLRISLTE